MKTAKMLTILVVALGLMVCEARVSEAADMGTAFTYQGHLYDTNYPADGLYDFQFKLFDDPCDANQVGGDVNRPDVDVITGHFTVELDFGSDVFNGNSVWLQIGVRPGELEDPNDYTMLSPRQEVTPTPYALHTLGLSLTSANNTLVGIGAGENNTGDYGKFVGQDAGYNNRGNSNTFIGNSAGFFNTTGTQNTFLGKFAGYSNTTGDENTFLGRFAGYSNTTGSVNTFLGDTAGYNTTTGNQNTFLGKFAGYSNTTGYENTFLGKSAGFFNTTGYYNTFLGKSAGLFNTTGNQNTFLGKFAGYNNNTGTHNTYLGYEAGHQNINGVSNVFIGHKAGYYETGSNKLYIANDAADANVLIYGDFSTGRVGIGTTSPAYDLDVNGDIRAIGSVYYGGTEGNADANAYTKADYVFEEGYDVMSIEQVEEYLRVENHLPWMTSAKQEKEENGDVIDMTRMAFETVETAENLQIQVIALNKRNKVLEKRIATLEKMILHQQFVSTNETH